MIPTCLGFPFVRSRRNKPDNSIQHIQALKFGGTFDVLTGPLTQIPPHARPMKARPTISIAALDAVISKSQPMINGAVIKSIVRRRPIEFMMNPISGQMTAAPTFTELLSSAHSEIEIVFKGSLS